MNKQTEVLIGGSEYIRADSVEKEVVVLDGTKSIAARKIGKRVIVRSRNEGINVGEVVVADETGVEIKNCRRLWYHKPKTKGLSWYEGVAISGICDDSKVSGTVKSKVIIENYSMTEMADKAYFSVMEAIPHGQN